MHLSSLRQSYLFGLPFEGRLLLMVPLSFEGGCIRAPGALWAPGARMRRSVARRIVGAQG